MKSEKLLKTIRPVCGEKVCLEPFSLGRLNEFYELYQKSKAKWEKFLVLHFRSIAEAARYINQQMGDKFTGYFILEKFSDKMVGFILGDEIEGDVISRSRAIGGEYEGRGYGYEANKLFEQLMKEAGYNALLLFCDEDNIRSQKLLQRDNCILVETKKIAYGPCSMNMLVYAKPLNYL